MINGKKLLAIVPARGGSKRLPGKNIKPIGGKPLIAWTIEAAVQSSYVDKIIVSTDDTDIASISRRFGAEIPFMRPKCYAKDTSTSLDVVMHAIDFFSDHEGCSYEYIILLQPTSPFRGANDIDIACKLLLDKSAEAIISVCEAEHSPLWANTIPDSLSLNSFVMPEILNKRSQDLPVHYRLNGAIYLISIEKLLKNRAFFIEENIFAYKMSQESSIDIDTRLDFKLAEVLLSEKISETP
ncbi:MAG: acylneuraminate cytidylyltransferase family protein [Cycloclasticus sp.]|jgi:CMP-N-acetylneuraminic acid synthetase